MAWRGYHRLAVAAFQTSTLVSYLHSLPVVSSFVAAAAIPRNTAATKMASSSSDDPYLWLEDVESEASLDFAKASNEATLKILGNPEDTGTYQKVLAVLESDDRIPHVSKFGEDPQTKESVLVNFWKDKANPKGLWRKTTMKSYSLDKPEWEILLDVDQLAKKHDISYVWKGSTPLPRARDGDCPMVRRALLSLSRGGSDAIHIKEFDLETKDFVQDRPFVIPEAKTRASYKSRDVLLVGSDFGPDTLTDSGYPRTVKEWVRGTKLEDAPTVFEGEKTDVACGVYVADERVWGGGIYEVQYRSITFYTSKYWVRKLEYAHLLAPDDPQRSGLSGPPSFVELPIQEDADFNLLGELIIISLRSDWKVGNKTFKQGALVVTTMDKLLADGPEACEFNVLFDPTDRTAYEYFTATKNYLILSTMDNVKAKLEFFKIDGTKLIPVGGRPEAKIRDCSCRPIDPYSGSDEFWFGTSDFVRPSTLYLSDAKRTESDESEDAFIIKQVKALPPKFDASELLTEQRFATSKDGTMIPYFIVYHKDTKLDGSNPALLYGYGGFEVSLGPHYVATAGLAWLERGGVYCEANIRGGGEYGPKWHQAGLKANRNKCYEDFIAVGEHLVESKVCTPKSLAARGGSNGGLLMGNMYIMRPDLFGAIHCAVPLLDMCRYHKLLAGASWMAEYGDPDTKDWEFLKTFSPYHNIDENADYPPILVTTSTRDDRVHPGHARKFVKKLQDTNKEWKVYYYENIEGGHGGAADAKQSAFMTSLAYDFMFDTLTRNIEAAQEKSLVS